MVEHSDFHSKNSPSNYEVLKDNKSTVAGSLVNVDAPIPFRLTSWRWPALVLMNLTIIGYLAVFDSPQPLEKYIKEAFGIGETKYSMLYSFLAFPSIVMPLVAGYLVDVMGARISMIIFAVLVLVGQMLVSYGASILSFELMVAGRFIFSLGADPLNVAQVVLVTQWFKKKELALAIASGTLVAGAAKAINSSIIPLIYDIRKDLADPLYFGSGICLFSLVCVIVMVIWDRMNEAREKEYDPSYGAETSSGEKVEIKAMFKFKPIVWLLIFNYGILDGVIFTFRSFLNNFYETQYGYSTQYAGNVISSHYVTMAIFCPLVGKFIDRVGKRASILFYISFLAILSLAIFILIPTCNQCFVPVLPMFILGICVAFDDAAVFAALPLVLEEKYHGTGFGLYYSVENMFLTVLPPITGTIIESFGKDKQKGYYWTIVFLFGMSILVAIESFFLLLTDKKNGSVLDKTTSSEEDEEEEETDEGSGTHKESAKGPAKTPNKTVAEGGYIQMV